MTNRKRVKTVSMMTLGCSKNVVDSEKLLGMLEMSGIKIIDNPAKSDSLIINTCGFIGPAKEENIRVILEAADIKKKTGIKKLIVMGCLSERYGDDLRAQIDEVDYFFGVNSAEEIVALLAGEQASCNAGARKLLTPNHYAYIKISEGCSQKCSFCAIPLIRGKNISRTKEDIIEEVKQLADAGVKEFAIIAQDTTYYGWDNYGSRELPDLLRKVAEVRGVEWLRIMYAYPSAFPLDTLDVMAEYANICKYIDMPLQHISDKVLSSMKRGIGKDKILRLLETIRKKLPDAAIRSSFIVGYPTETQADFHELVDFVKNIKLDRVGVFQYSPEEGTGAYTLNDIHTQELKQERANTIMEIQSEISLEKNLEKVGKVFKVLTESKKDNYYIGRTEFDAPDIDNSVLFKSRKKLGFGSFANVKIASATEYDLFGRDVE